MTALNHATPHSDPGRRLRRPGHGHPPEGEGVEDFVVFERDEEVGGTWWANTYPGCQCDSPRICTATRSRRTPMDADSTPSSPRCGTTCASAPTATASVLICGWAAPSSGPSGTTRRLWRLETIVGTFTAQVVIAAPGALSEPRIPELPGIEASAAPCSTRPPGTMTTTSPGARWRWLEPARARSRRSPASSRSPSTDGLPAHPAWVVPHRDRPITGFERALYRRVPAAQRTVRTAVYLGRELLVTGLAYRPQLMKALQRAAEAHMAKQVPDPELRARLTPDYCSDASGSCPPTSGIPRSPGPTSTWSRRGDRGPTGGRGRGRRRPARGRHADLRHRVPRDRRAVRAVHPGARRRAPRDLWHGSPAAYRGAAVPGFPNMFWMVGPDTGLGHNSIVFMIEAQINYLLDALETMARGATASRSAATPTTPTTPTCNRDGPTVWNTGGCSSWYLDANGRNATSGPTSPSVSGRRPASSTRRHTN